MERSRKGSLSNDTRQRYELEMQTIARIVYRELQAIGLVTGPLPSGWTPDNAVALSSTDDPRISADLSSLIEAAFIVHRTYQSIDGERERAIDGFERMADGIRAAYAADSDIGVNAYLSTIANVGGAIALNEEERIDSTSVRELRADLDWTELLRCADRAESLANHLATRRPAALGPRTYAAKRAGPLSHLCWELSQPMVTASEQASTAAYFGPQGTEELMRDMKRPRLTPEQIGSLIDETYAKSRRTEDDLADAAERVGQRVLNFQESTTIRAKL